MKVAVYGTLRKKGSNHSLLENAKYIETVRVYGWSMLTNGWYPTAKPDINAKSILVEVYDINDDTWNDLCGLEGYPDFFGAVDVAVNDGKAKMFVCPEDKYNASVGILDSFGVIDSGDWMDGV